MSYPTHDHEDASNDHGKLRKRVIFFLVAMGVITLTFGVLFLFDFLPEAPSTPKDESAVAVVTEVKEEIKTEQVAPLPVSIHFDSLDREVTILNPESGDVKVLDEALLQGVVRHPGSADFSEKGTIFLLGHSSYLPVVHNKNFQAFNGIQKMKWGDIIRLRSSNREYVYTVDRVYEAKSSNASITLQHDAAKLVLATCNSFGAKEDRFVLEATLVESHPIEEGKG